MTGTADTADTVGSGAARFVGQRVKRREDPRLLTGRGRYVDDVTLPRLLHAAFLRSDVARGAIRSIDVDAARALPGVRGVFTAAELNPICGPLHASLTGPRQASGPPERALADDDVRFVGEPIAIVVADSRYLAEDACELIVVDIEPHAPVVDMNGALADDVIVHPEIGTNTAGAMPQTADPELEEILASAPHVISRTFTNGRVTNVPMEGRGLVASWDPYAGEVRIWPSSQSPHEVKAFCSRVLDVPAHRVHVQMGDVGGGFGQKMFGNRDEACVMLAARLLGRPVKWVEDRRENLIAANQARREAATVTMALDDEGHILGAKMHLVEDVGAFPMGGAAGSGMLVALIFPGPYRMRRFGFSSDAVFTNTCGKAAYRGPWAIETIVREQLMDHAARGLGLDPLELRRRNVIRPSELPYTLPSGLVYDVVTPTETLEQAVAAIDWDGFRAEQAAARAEGRYLGIGLSLCIEPSAMGYGSLAMEQAVVRLDATGKVLVLMGTGSHGHSLETTIPQVVADHLGCALDDVQFVQGDTDATPHGPGTGGSRSAVIAGGAAQAAALKMREKVLHVAAHLLEAAVDDLEVAGSRVSVRGTPTRGLSFAEIADTAYANPAGLPPGTEPGLEASHRFTAPSPFTWSNACHVCTCEVDPDTGRVQLLRYLVSEDCGVMINPMVVEGQIAGGVAQGIGQVLLEEMAYDADGNPLATTFLDYLLPTTTEVPDLEVTHIETPSNNPGGYKGMGEGGAIASPAAVANAIADALAPFGVTVTDLPLGPTQIRSLLRDRLPPTHPPRRPPRA